MIPGKQGKADINLPIAVPPPIGGLNSLASLMGAPVTDAVLLENFIPYPDRLEVRPGAQSFATGSGKEIDALYVYPGLTGTDLLLATTDSGVFNITAGGAWPAASIALTDGKTVGSILSTGASTYLTICNGVDTVKQFDGTTWSAIATFGAVATTEYSYIETYRQRYYLIRKNSMNLEYLAANSISGAATQYNLGAIFRRGGYLVALGTWTIDGGNGPDDHLAIATSQGEIAIFTGTDPASASTWSLKGVYYIGRPLGKKPLYKYGGDLLFLCENGLFPLSDALKSAAIDRTQGITKKIQPLFAQAAQDFFSNEGWDIIALPDVPLLLVNIAGSPNRYSFAMHLQTGSWTRFSGWNARCFARKGSTLYLGLNSSVAKMTGTSDFGVNITATMLQAHSRLRIPANKKVEEIKPYFQSTGAFNYVLGIADDFISPAQINSILISSSSSVGIWGTSRWGAAYWTSDTNIITTSWRTVPNKYSMWKAIYLQIVSTSTSAQYFGSDLLVMRGSGF